MAYVLLTCTIDTYIKGDVDGIQPKISLFSTQDLILVKYKVVHYFFQPILFYFSYLNCAQNNLVILLRCALKKYIYIQTVFRKLMHCFLAIELLAFSIMQNSIFIARESSQYLGF